MSGPVGSSCQNAKHQYPSGFFAVGYDVRTIGVDVNWRREFYSQPREPRMDRKQLQNAAKARQIFLCSPDTEMLCAKEVDFNDVVVRALRRAKRGHAASAARRLAVATMSSKLRPLTPLASPSLMAA